MTILAFGPESLEAITRVREFAEDPANWRRLGADQVVSVPGDIEAYTLEFPIGYKVVYSIDAVEDEAMRHLSVSVTTPAGMPQGVHPAAMQQIMGLYEFGDDADVGIIPGDPPWVVHALEAFTSRTG